MSCHLFVAHLEPVLCGLRSDLKSDMSTAVSPNYASYVNFPSVLNTHTFILVSPPTSLDILYGNKLYLLGTQFLAFVCPRLEK